MVWGMVGSWRKVISACMEGMIFALGPKERRMADEKLMSGGTEL